MGRLKSRKFWVTFVTGTVLLFAKQLGLEIDASTIYALVTMVTGYNVSQGYVDGKKESAATVRATGHMEDLAHAKVALESAKLTPDADA